MLNNMEKQTMVSLNELAKTLVINKSKLSYYASLQLIKPIRTIGKMMIFDKESTLKLIQKINTLKKKGVSLTKIKEQLN